MTQRITQVLTLEEARALIDACPTTTIGLRDRAFIVALWRGAMRIGATLKLMPADFLWAQNTITVHEDKCDSGRAVPIDNQAMHIVIREWADRRKELGLNGVHPFFCAVQKHALGKPLCASHYRRLLKKLAIKAGIEKRVYPHLLRHTGASMMYAEGTPIPAISRILGHSDIVITSTYLHELRPDVANKELIERKWM